MSIKPGVLQLAVGASLHMTTNYPLLLVGGYLCLLASCTDSATTREPVPPTAQDGGVGDADASEVRRCPLAFPAVVSVLEPSPGTRCEVGCSSISALQWDASRGCKKTVALCFDCGATCGGGERPGCFKNVEDGRVVSVQSWVMVDRPAWVSCDATLEQQITLGDSCP